MLTNIILAAGLIPGLMATPIMRGQNAAVNGLEYRQVEHDGTYAVHSAPALVHSVPSVAPSVPAPPAASREVTSSKDPKTNELPATTFPVSSAPARSSVTSSHVVDPAYAVKTPPVRQPMVPPVVSSAALPVTAPAKPSVPAQDAYAVKEEPIHTVATADPVHVLPATASAKPSVPAQDAYAVKEEPIHTSATADPVHVLPATASAKPSVPAQDAYAVKKAPVISTSAVDPVHTQPAVAPAKPSVPAQDAYAVEKSPLISASAVDAVQAAPSDAPHAAIKAEGAEGSECDQQCEVKCQTTNIAFDVTQCRSSCLAECRGEGKSSAHGTADRYVPATHGKAAHGLSLDHESVSYEECIESCKGNWQTAGIAFDVSQGEYDCASACARYSAEDTKVILKKKTVPTVSPFRIPPPAPPVELSSETVSYDSCMRECKGKWQTGDIFVSQGEYDCASDCAQYASDDKKIVVKKATPLSPLPASSFRLPPPAPPVEFSSETVSYESCMQKCKGKWQTGDIFVSQGKYDCASDCAQYASDDKKIVVKKAMPPSPLPASSFRLPVPKPHVKIASSEVTYESCMSKCKGKWQTGDIFVSQGKYDCESGCAEYASDDKKIVVKKATPPSPLPASSFRLPVPKPDVKIASSEVNFESCMRSCKGRWQTAGIGFDVSQGDYDCKSHCAKYAAEDDEVIIRKDTLPLPAHEDEFPSAPAARVFHKGSIAWEACMDGCKSRWQTAGIALDFSQGDFDCDRRCARYASEHTTVNAPRQLVGDSLLGIL